MINIKAPASLNVVESEPDDEGFQETVISEREEDKGVFLCGPEWKVRITTKADQCLDIQQVTEGEDHRVLITPRPKPPPEEKKVEKVASARRESTARREVKVEVKKGDKRQSIRLENENLAKNPRIDKRYAYS